LYNTVQELRVELTYNLETLAASAYYLLDVSETLPIYSFDGAITTDYGLAWNDDEAGIVTLPTGANGFPTDSSYVNESQYLPNFPAPTFVPEPGALSLLGLGVMSLILRRKKRWTG
ncbi:MAG TPA: PEP-CTERM sorting domain-containing protein, partial [Phycisphaerae bacterium]|nr:PEP-CTERM sorting domain-containing protein [Phycisphaerae bacterium]